ncbi:hypothetical protein [Limnospira fusiformis]
MSQKVSFFIVALGGDQLEIFTKIYQSAVTHQYLFSQKGALRWQ